MTSTGMKNSTRTRMATISSPGVRKSMVRSLEG
jgi:hypothetical protein